jgi:3-hydroxyethyl bacteriochlorophyllide a dehydrogenase
MDTLAIVMEEPERLALERLTLDDPGDGDIVVDIAWSGVSTGTERLLWSGRMPNFPGMGYPLVPGYESVGTVVEARAGSGRAVGETVFVPGARCFGPVRGLFGGAAQRVVLPGARSIPIDAALGEAGALIALAATARHAIAAGDGAEPDLIVGHGVLGRLLARVAVAIGAEPTVWETNPIRMGGAEGYRVVHPDEDERRDYRAIYDVSGDPKLLDSLIGRLAKGGEVCLAGFYEQPLSFAFPPAFMKEARIRVAAEWQPGDLTATKALIEEGFLNLDGLITHRSAVSDADAAYRTAFGDPACLKMILDWRTAA